MIVGDIPKSIEVIGTINTDCLKVYSRSWSCLSSLFYFAGSAYLLDKKYIQATKLLETIVCFSDKYKHFFTKSFQYDNIIRQLDRALLLLCICLSLNQIPINTLAKGLITDKCTERFEKLLKYDKACFEESFTHGSSKMIQPLLKSDDFKNNGFLENTEDPMKEIVNTFQAEFAKSQVLNNVEGILDLYPRIPIAKFVKIMKIEMSECQKLLDDFKNSKSVVLSESNFDQQVIINIVKGLNFSSFVVIDNEIVVETDIKEESHLSFFEKQSILLKTQIKKIENL